MSTMAWISMTLLHEVEPRALIESLQDVSWSLNYEGGITYLPFGDKGDYDWQQVIYSQESVADVLHIIGRKFQLEEEIGVMIVWSDSNRGITIALKRNVLEFSCSINRKVLEIGRVEITDFRWYLERLLPAAIFNKNTPEKIEFTQL